MLERDMYPGIKEYFMNQGYTVKGEVNDCDVVAIKEDFIIIVEMKLRLNLEVILQAIDRQKRGNIVYVAVVKNNRVLKSKKFKESLYLLKRLELGLLLVTNKNEHYLIEEALHPTHYPDHEQVKRDNQARRQLLKEFNERVSDNHGGVTGEKIITAYKEKAIQIATCLNQLGPLSIKELKLYGCDEKKTASILQQNHYGWFNRIKRGLYSLTDKGREELNDYPELVTIFLSIIKNNTKKPSKK